MKSYTEFLKGCIGRNGSLIRSSVGGHYEFSIFDRGEEKLVDVGMDYAEFLEKDRHVFIPLSLLVVHIFRF
jgi:hypothetical protein